MSLVRNSAGSLHWYHPELDLLRFSAFCMVFVFHAGGGRMNSPVAPGAYGVDLFFTLSAYLITEILLREQRVRGQFNLKSFYIRRILRIWPLYFVFLTLTFLFAQRLLVDTEDFPLSAKLMFLFFVGNWQFVLGRPIRTIASLLWSVCVEEQFYLTWPLLLRRWGNRLPLVAGVLLLVSNLWRLGLFLAGPVTRPIDTVWKTTFTHLDAIVAGALAAYYLRGAAPALTAARRFVLGAAGVFGLLVTGLVLRPDGGRSLIAYPLAAASCAALLFAVLRPMRPEKIGWLRGYAIHLGRISYGLYVFHAACLALSYRLIFMSNPSSEFWTRRAAAFGMTIVAAECSYHLIELPFLRLKEKFSAVSSAPQVPEASAAEAASITA